MSLEDFAGYGLSGFKSFGSSDIQRIGPMGKVHLLVGKNNVGKSNSIRFMELSMQMLKANPNGPFAEIFPTDTTNTPSHMDRDESRKVSIAVRLTKNVVEQLQLETVANGDLLKLFKTEAFSYSNENIVWFDFVKERKGHQLIADIDQYYRAVQILGDEWSFSLGQLSSDLTSGSGSDVDNWNRVVFWFEPWRFVPSIQSIDAIRDIQQPPQDGDLRRGGGVIKHLIALQNPDEDNYLVYNARFKALQNFVKDVLDDPDARIEVPNTRDNILVHTQGNAPKNITKLGTGISEVIHIATVATGFEGQLICIEEPEIHLHPTLQRKLIEYLANNTDNNYLISTHSASMLNAELATISHVKLDHLNTIITSVVKPSELSMAVFDLGNRASDLVQSNYIVWVEGPSDRLYISNWLKKYDPYLLEGAHYSIMFYGGAMLNHLSVDDAETDELIDLLKINRNFSIVIDSDIKEEGKTINATKTRIVNEAEAVGGHSWITESYTIENYIPNQLISSAVSNEYPNKKYAVKDSKFASPIGQNFAGTDSKPSKVMIAKRIISSAFEYDNLPQHLQDNIIQISKRVRSANQLQSR